MFGKTLFVAQIGVTNEDFIVHFFYGKYTILKEHDFKNRKNNKRVDRLQQTHECCVLHSCVRYSCGRYVR